MYVMLYTSKIATAAAVPMTALVVVRSNVTHQLSSAAVASFICNDVSHKKVKFIVRFFVSIVSPNDKMGAILLFLQILDKFIDYANDYGNG